MVAPAIGPTLGGILVDVLNWQWTFIVNIPVGVASIVMVFFLLEETPRRNDIRLDVLGLILCSAACFALLLALGQGQGIPLCLFLSKKAEGEETWKQKERFSAPTLTDSEHLAG
ncbi:MAG: MFS transporter [Syntrophomonas sp.]